MRMLCPNFDREDALETVLELPVPEEIFASNNHRSYSWPKISAWLTPRDRTVTFASAEIQFLLGVIGAPLVPFPIRSDWTTFNHDIRGGEIESSMAKYIVQQYIAASGGEHALNSIHSMYALGKVKMAASEFVGGEDAAVTNPRILKSMKHGAGDIGGFLMWQKRPDLWSLEMMVSGCKISAGSDGKVAWRQTPWQNSHASRGPPRPLRRSIQVPNFSLILKKIIDNIYFVIYIFSIILKLNNNKKNK